MKGLMLIVAALLLGPDITHADEPRIEPGAENWVIVTDIPPFSLRQASTGRRGPGLYEGILGDNEQLIFADVGYRDNLRRIPVGVSVIQDDRTTFLDHVVESTFRDSTTGRMDSEVSIVSLFGQPVYSYCDEPPQCKRRLYRWRSGLGIVIDIEAKAFSADVEPVPCPEPTEILQAYLQRYPSSLPLYTEDDEHAKKWRRDQTALELAAADYQLDQRYASVPAEDQWLALAAARDHLTTFAELRQAAFRGPDAAKERGRIDKLRALPSGTQLDELKKIRLEYRQWWSTHQNDPVYLPPR